MLGVVRCKTGPSPRVRVRALAVQHLCGGYKQRGLHVFRGGQRRHHGRFGASEEENGGGGAGGGATSGELVLATSL